MRSTEERLAIMHRRARELERRRIGTRIAASGGICAALVLSLLALVGSYSFPSVVDSGDAFTASSLLGDGAGGYVIAAIIAFAAGVAITLGAIRLRGKSSADAAKGPRDTK